MNINKNTMVRSWILVVGYIFISLISTAQKPGQTDVAARSSKEWRNMAESSSLLTHVQAENIGPTIFNGRVADLDVNPKDPTEFFVAYASGGLWHTINNGISFTPLFQQESVMTIGDIAVDWTSGIMYLGSGEQNSSRSSYAGNGIYRSHDKGKTWTHLGLDETHHISKVIIHPSDPDIVWVAALGHLYTSNPERGVFKSIDGGKSWTHTLQVNNLTGASDLVVHPNDPNILYAATWERQRKAWNFSESGEGSGIYQSTDGGDSWKLVSRKDSGFVTGKGAGRIGLDIAVKDGKTYVYAIIDNNHRRPKEQETKKKPGLQKNQLLVMHKDTFLRLKEEIITDFLEENDFPEKYKARDVIELIKKGKVHVSDLATYNDNANTALFDTPVIGAEVYRSENGGVFWHKTHEGYLDDVYYSYGYYFGQIRVFPGDPEKVYIFGVPILKSENGGKTWKNIDGSNVHSDHHALWLNPARPGHMINGNDGGVNMSYDDGQHWFKCTHPEVGQFYYVNTDQNEPYNVYGGLQDNGVWMGSHQYKNSTSWQSTGEYPYKSILGGDGMQVQIDNRDNSTIYAGFQFGNYFRINKSKKERVFITPKHDLGQPPYRWNWQTPILLSPHNQDIIYMGAQKLLRSMNQGKDFVAISHDLTHGGREGNIPFGTITCLDESRLKFGLIYAGTDDGNIHVTKDGGNTWTNISANLPKDLWVSRVQSSAFDEGTVYATLNGYRNDHFNPYVYRSDDYGQTWQNIASNLPNEPVNVIKEDPADRDILYVGTDHGTYVSLNRGQEYMILSGTIPKVPVHDVVIQKKARHLIIGTHGRSLYKVNVKHLPDVKNESNQDILLFKPAEIRFNHQWGKRRNAFNDPVVPKMVFEAFSNTDQESKLEIRYIDGTLLKTKTLMLRQGLTTYEAEISVDKNHEKAFIKVTEKSDWVKSQGALNRSDDDYFYLIPGKYDIRLVTDKSKVSSELIVK